MWRGFQKPAVTQNAVEASILGGQWISRVMILGGKRSSVRGLSGAAWLQLLPLLFVICCGSNQGIIAITSPSPIMAGRFRQWSVYGFYGGGDGGVDGSVPATTDAMKAAGKLYEPVTYEGADHGFMRLGDGYFIINRANKAARDQAFARLVTLLREMGTR
jgi:hypothetical protein